MECFFSTYQKSLQQKNFSFSFFFSLCNITSSRIHWMSKKKKHVIQSDLQKSIFIYGGILHSVLSHLNCEQHVSFAEAVISALQDAPSTWHTYPSKKFTRYFVHQRPIRTYRRSIQRCRVDSIDRIWSY